jgi:hypothetical protein
MLTYHGEARTPHLTDDSSNLCPKELLPSSILPMRKHLFEIQKCHFLPLENFVRSCREA